MENTPLFLTLKNTEKKRNSDTEKKEAKYGKSISTNIDFHENLFCDSDSAHFLSQTADFENFWHVHSSKYFGSRESRMRNCHF